MMCCSRPLGVLRSLVCLTLIGVAVTVLIGPVLTIGGVLLPFVVIGALAWGGYRLSRAVVLRLSGRRERLVVIEERLIPREQRPVPPPVQAPVVRPVMVMDALPVSGSRPASRLRSLARTAMHVVIEVACGAALGAALAVVVDWQTVTRVEHAALGAAIGAVVGFVVGGSRVDSARDQADERGKTASRAA
jgi:hypothetical protein